MSLDQDDDRSAKIRESVLRRGIHEVYHFTSVLQVPLIVRHAAIHPRSVLRPREIPFIDDPWRFGNPAKAAELVDFVSAALRLPWGMIRKDCHPVVLSLRPDLLWRARTAFLGEWGSDSKFKGLADVLSRMRVEDFDSMFAGPGNSLRDGIPGEVMIQGSVALSDVRKIYCPNAYSRRILTELLRDEFSKAARTILIDDRPQLFPRSDAA